MKFLRASCLLTLVVLAFAGCYDEPDFGEVPQLTTIDVYFKEITKISDSLVVRVGFEDGDGDLGVFPEETAEEFFRIPNPNTGEPYWIYNSENPDPDLPPYDCSLYRYAPLTEGDSIRDTLYVERNEAYYNYNITLYTKENGQFQEFDLLAEPSCPPPLGGRFLPLRDDFEVGSPLSGTLQWGSVGAYNARFRNDTLKVEVTIRDRAGNVSNAISTEAFTLKDIERGVPEEEG